jgi:hypothetical protein
MLKADLDKFLSGLILRQLPFVIASILTGAILIFWLGFWAGIIVNAILWGISIFIWKAFVGNRQNAVDKFQDEKFLLNFLLALIGRKN